MRCPGQDSRYWKPEDIFETACQKCGYQVEFFRDEPSRKCKHCGSGVLNPKIDFGCAAHCKFAEQCFGELPSELLAQKEQLFRTRVAAEMKRYFGRDFKRIGHAAKVAEYAEKILAREKGDIAVVLTAAYLHDIGIKKEEEQKNESTDCNHEKLGVPVAEEILQKLNASSELIEEACDIIGHHHHPQSKETENFKVLYDADRLVNLEESQKENPLGEEDLKKMIERAFLTDTAKSLAEDIFLKRE